MAVNPEQILTNHNNLSRTLNFGFKQECRKYIMEYTRRGCKRVVSQRLPPSSLTQTGPVRYTILALMVFPNETWSLL